MDSLKDFLQHFDPYTTPSEVSHRNYSEYRRRNKTGENIALTYDIRSTNTGVRRANRRRVIALKGRNSIVLVTVEGFDSILEIGKENVKPISNAQKAIRKTGTEIIRKSGFLKFRDETGILHKVERGNEYTWNVKCRSWKFIGKSNLS